MNLLLLTLAPISSTLTHAPLPVRAIPTLQAAGHTLFLAAPLAGDAEEVRAALGLHAVLPLLPADDHDWGRLMLNAHRVSHWAQRWRPDLYLADGTRAATLAHAGRGATGGHGLSVLWLPALHYARAQRLGHWLERRALHECDRIITDDEALASQIIRQWGARGGDLSRLSEATPAALQATCAAYLAEPPGFL